jgi:hypothetical protein
MRDEASPLWPLAMTLWLVAATRRETDGAATRRASNGAATRRGGDGAAARRASDGAATRRGARFERLPEPARARLVRLAREAAAKAARRG